MDIALYTCTSENNRIDKSPYITNGFLLQGTLRSDSSVIDPVIEIEKTNPAIYNYNYMHIKDFGRWYYNNNIEAKEMGLWEIYAHVDVLFTWRPDILGSRAVIDKSSNVNDANLYIDDGSFVMDSHKFNNVIEFPNGLEENGALILIASGGPKKEE